MDFSTFESDIIYVYIYIIYLEVLKMYHVGLASKFPTHLDPPNGLECIGIWKKTGSHNCSPFGTWNSEPKQIAGCLQQNVRSQMSGNVTSNK